MLLIESGQVNVLFQFWKINWIPIQRTLKQFPSFRRYRIFSRKSVTHPHTRFWRIFFLGFLEKKKQFIFLLRKSLKATRLAEKQLTQKIWYFFTFSLCFFSNKNVCVFFFQRKVYYLLTASFSGDRKKNSDGKKHISQPYLTIFPKTWRFLSSSWKKNTEALIPPRDFCAIITPGPPVQRGCDHHEEQTIKMKGQNSHLDLENEQPFLIVTLWELILKLVYHRLYVWVFSKLQVQIYEHSASN